MQESKIIGILLATAASMIVATSISSSNTHFVYAAANSANCDQAGYELNPAGNIRGNGKDCQGLIFDGPKEPVRDCDSPNGLKNNDEDSVIGCIDRGN